MPIQVGPALFEHALSHFPQNSKSLLNSSPISAMLICRTNPIFGSIKRTLLGLLFLGLSGRYLYLWKPAKFEKKLHSLKESDWEQIWIIRGQLYLPFHHPPHLFLVRWTMCPLLWFALHYEDLAPKKQTLRKVTCTMGQWTVSFASTLVIEVGI